MATSPTRPRKSAAPAAADAPLAPPYRRLRAYTFDPSLATQLDAAPINQAILCMPWEKLEPGPVGEYLEVVDYDPASGCFYKPVDQGAEQPSLRATYSRMRPRDCGVEPFALLHGTR